MQIRKFLACIPFLDGMENSRNHINKHQHKLAHKHVEKLQNQAPARKSHINRVLKVNVFITDNIQNNIFL